MAADHADEWHREVLSADQHQALLISDQILRGTGCFIAGGTALALRFGHRRSRDIDWFTTTDMDYLGLAAAFARQPGVTVIHAEPGTIHAEIGPIPVSVIRYRYPADAPDHLDSIPLASVRTAVGMKLLAIVNRGYKRDFIDVAEIMRHGTPLDRMISWATADLPGMTAESILRSLAWRGDADLQPEPEGVSPADWLRALTEVDEAIRRVIAR